MKTNKQKTANIDDVEATTARMFLGTGVAIASFLAMIIVLA
jgi:hypothetical protein